jgi:hypothetical protein
MPLAPIPLSRKRLPTRRISDERRPRGNDLFDIEARVVDTTDDDFVLASFQAASRRGVRAQRIRSSRIH